MGTAVEKIRQADLSGRGDYSGFDFGSRQAQAFQSKSDFPLYRGTE